MNLTSTAFQPEGKIPQQFTCEGQDVSPDVSWSEAPKETKSFVLITHDPDAPRPNGFVHWVLYNIPASTNHIPQNVPKNASVPDLGLQGRNDSGKVGYMGPCPPSGTHRYFFRLYALRSKLELGPSATYKQVIEAMEGKIIEQGELMGTYAKVTEKVA
jgi:Raf kinase inhibitor-like YbhB/YbcL family protein